MYVTALYKLIDDTTLFVNQCNIACVDYCHILLYWASRTHFKIMPLRSILTGYRLKTKILVLNQPS